MKYRVCWLSDHLEGPQYSEIFDTFQQAYDFAYGQNAPDCFWCSIETVDA